MKKIIIASFIIVSLIGCNITFAQPTIDSVELTQDLIRINNDLGIAIRNTLKEKPDKDAITKDINFIKTRLDSALNKVNTLDKPNANLLKKREYETIKHIITLNLLTVNGLLLYLQDSSAYEKFLLDAIGEYNTARDALKSLKDSLSTAYKVTF